MWFGCYVCVSSVGARGRDPFADWLTVISLIQITVLNKKPKRAWIELELELVVQVEKYPQNNMAIIAPPRSSFLFIM